MAPPQQQPNWHDPKQVAIVRAALRRAGYHVDAGGAATPRMLNAWQHFRHNQGGVAAGKASAAWNADNPMPSKGHASDASILKQINKSGVVRKTAIAVRKDFSGGPKPSKKPVDVQVGGATKKASNATRTHVKAVAASQKLGAKVGGKGAGNNVPGVAAPKLGNSNVEKLLGPGLADKIAGEQYDPQILELQNQINQGKLDTKQAQADIANWYGQVRGAQDTAGQRDTTAADSARTAVSNELQGILNSLGGSRGAGVVAAQGMGDLTSLAAQGKSQEEFNADLAPILSQEEAGQHTRQQALASQTAQKLQASLVGARGARGQALAKAQMDVEQANNQARQQNFQNRLAQQNALLAAKSLGLNVANVNSEITARRAATKQNQKRLDLQTAAQQQASGHPDFGRLNYTDRLGLVSDAVNRAAAEIAIRPGHNDWDPVHVTNSALTNLRGGGYTSARGKGYKGPGVNPQNRAIILSLLPRALAQAHQTYLQNLGKANAAAQQASGG